jgi:hypothetical protein
MVYIPRFQDEKEPKLDLKAGRQIFDKEYTREDKASYAIIPGDSDNPVDERLRRLAIRSLTGKVNVKDEFFNKWAMIELGVGMIKDKVVGRVKDLFLHSRYIYIKTAKGNIFVVPFECVLKIHEHEIVGKVKDV